MADRIRRNADGTVEWYDDEKDEAPTASTRKERVAAGRTRTGAKSSEDRVKRASEHESTMAKALQYAPMLNMFSAPVPRAIIQKLTGYDTADLATSAASGFSQGLDRRFNAAVNAVKDTVKGEKFSEAYKANRYAEDQVRANRQSRAGLAGDVAEFGGSMLLPAGGAGKAIKAANWARKGAPLARTGQAIVGGIGAGATSGALQGFTGSEDWTDVPETLTNIGRGAAVGGTLGGALGGAGSFVAPAIRGLGRHASGNEGKLAQRGAELGDEITLKTIQESGGVAKAEQQAEAMAKAGLDPVMADTSRNASATARAVMDTNVPGIDDVALDMGARGMERGSRIRSLLERVTGQDYGTSAAEKAAGIRSGRLKVGEDDYKIGGILEQPVNLTPRQSRALKKAIAPDAQTEAFVQNLIDEAEKDVMKNTKVPRIGPNDRITYRVMDQALRRLGEEVTGLYKAGGGASSNVAAGLENTFDKLSGVLKRANPAYAKMVEAQAKGLALEKQLSKLGGGGVADKVFRDPRAVWEGIPAKASEQEAYRYALIDRIFNDAQYKNSALESIRKALLDTGNQPSQELWGFILGGKKNFPKVLEHLNLEHSARATEANLLGGPNTAQRLGAAMAHDNQMQGAMVEAGRAGIGAGTGSGGMFGNAFMRFMGFLTQLARGEEGKVANTQTLQNLTRKARPGDVTRLEQRVMATRAARTAGRARAANHIGRAVGQVVPAVTPKSYEEY